MTKPAIPPAALAQHTAILGKTGAGKSSTAKLAVEQVVAEDARVCILDPIKSDWWGLTSSADGRRPGLPFHILGGPHGHVPLHSSAGTAIAELVATSALRHSIIDMADFEPGGQARFFVDFAPAMLRRMRGVVYLVIEEAHLFAPKERSGVGAENMSIHWAKTLATAGRSKGIRLILVSQRIQALHNALLGSCDTMIAHRLTAPADQAPVLSWLKANASPALTKEIASSLSSLPTGTAWICAGEANIAERRAFPRITTYDNSATPTGDGDDRHVRTAAVDTAALRAIIGNAVEEAEANDPKKLRAEIATLKRQMADAAAKASKAGQTPDPQALAEAEQRGYHRGYAEGDKAGHRRGIYEGYAASAKCLRNLADDLEQRVTSDKAWQADIEQRAGTALGVTVTTTHAPVAHRIERRSPEPKAAGSSPAGRTIDMPKTPLLRILHAIRWLQLAGFDPADRAQVALLAGYTPTGGGFRNYLGALRSAGNISYPSADTIALTPEGTAQVPAINGRPTSYDLHATLQAKLPAPQWNLLATLIGRYPDNMTREDLAQANGYTATGGGFRNYLGALRSLGFIDYPSPNTVVAEPCLFIEGR